MITKHQLEVAVSNGDASWCACTCGWVSSKTTADDAQGMWATHLVEHSFDSTPSR